MSLKLNFAADTAFMEQQIEDIYARKFQAELQIQQTAITSQQVFTRIQMGISYLNASLSFMSAVTGEVIDQSTLALISQLLAFSQAISTAAAAGAPILGPALIPIALIGMGMIGQVIVMLRQNAEQTQALFKDQYNFLGDP